MNEGRSKTAGTRRLIIKAARNHETETATKTKQKIMENTHTERGSSWMNPVVGMLGVPARHVRAAGGRWWWWCR